MTIILYVLGFVIVSLGGSSLAEHTLSLAKKLRLSSSAMGTALGVLAVTLPVVALSVSAAGEAPQLASCSVLGFVIFNAALTGGIAAVAAPVSGFDRRRALKLLLFFLLGSGMAALSVSSVKSIGVGAGIILLSLFVIYVLTSREDGRERAAAAQDQRLELTLVGLLIGGAGIYIGTGLVMDNGIIMASELGISQSAFGLIFNAAGLSLPVLTSVIVSVRKKQGKMALGVIAGANVAGLLLGLGLPGVSASIPAEGAAGSNIAGASAAMCALLIPAVLTGSTSRIQGAVLIIAYAAVCALNFI